MTAADPVALRERVRARALDLGFDACGVAAAETTPVDKAALAGFLAAGRHRDMAWMMETADRRADPRVLWPAARTVISLGMNYGPPDPDPVERRPDRAHIALYARRRDYHDVVKQRLKALARWLVAETGAEVKVFVDTAPVMEKPLARQAGLGWIGKHTNLVSRDFGSWLVLGEVFTTLAIPPDRPAADHCGSCTACRDACPTGALDVPYRMDTGRCLAYLSVEAADPVPDSFAAAMGNRVFGCDDCLAVCPWNKFARPATEPKLAVRPAVAAPDLSTLARLDEAAFRNLFSGTPVRRRGHARFTANARLALATVRPSDEGPASGR